MTINERLFQLLALSSPPPVPAIGANWFPLQAKQGIAPPYGTYARISSPALNTMDHQQATRLWRYQLSVFDPEFAKADSYLNAALSFLTAFTGFNDIQRVLEITRGDRWLEVQRVYMLHADVDIMENLP